MKKLLLAVTMIALSTSVMAQEPAPKTAGGTTFSVAGNVGTGTKSGDKTTYGADLQVDIPLASKLKGTGSAGYQHFRSESGIYHYDHNMIILLAGLKALMTSSLYAHGQAGYGINTGSGGGGDFAYALSLGYMLNKNFDLALRYLSIGSLNAVLLRVALTLGANK